MLRLRPYNKNDAEIIMSWIKGENAFYKWTAGVLGEYPISAEQFNTVSNLMAFTAIDDNEVVGFFTMRRPNEFYECTSQQKVDTTLYFYTLFNEHNTPYTVLESDNSESMPDVLH